MAGKEEMDMTMKIKGFISSFVNMDGNSRVMLIKLLVTKMNDVEVELILEIIGDRDKDSDDESNGDVSNCLTMTMDEDTVKKEPEEEDYKDSFYLNYQSETGEEAPKTVNDILQDVGKLTTVDKLLLYQKLPNFRTNTTDSFIEPLTNPLGSNSETIIWMKNHLQEDPQGNIPKQEVYDEYVVYCRTNSIKPLSTADFGKVMKQVFPHVHPRRLGTRGNSRYCYAGLRKILPLPIGVGSLFGDSCVPLHLQSPAPLYLQPGAPLPLQTGAPVHLQPRAPLALESRAPLQLEHRAAPLQLEPGEIEPEVGTPLALEPRAPLKPGPRATVQLAPGEIELEPGAPGQDLKHATETQPFQRELEREGKRKLTTDHMQMQEVDVEPEIGVGEKRSKVDNVDVKIEDGLNYVDVKSEDGLNDDAHESSLQKDLYFANMF